MRKILALFLALLCIVPMIALPLSAAGATTETVYVRDLSKTTVDQDLIGSFYRSADGAERKIETADEIAYAFPAAQSGQPQVISVVEMGYEAAKSIHSSVDLYVYVYTPQKSTHYAKSINLCLNFDMQKVDGEGQSDDPNDWNETTYNPHSLQLAGVSSNGTVKKYRIADLDISANTFKGVRRYDISTLTYLSRSTNRKEIVNVEQSYVMRGEHSYGDYSTTTKGFDVLLIDDLRQTHFRYRNQQDENMLTQINSVYFAIPDDKVAEWGNLFSIKSSWYRERTTPIVVTNYEDLYNDFAPHIGKNLTQDGIKVDRSIFLADYTLQQNGANSYDYVWFYNEHANDSYFNHDADSTNILWWLFYNEVEELADANVQTADMISRFQKYCDDISKYLEDDESPRDHAIMENWNVVQSYEDAKAETGYDYGFVTETIKAENLLDGSLQGYEHKNGFHKFWADFVGKNYDEEDLQDIHSIQMLDANAVKELVVADKDDISKKYLIADNDIKSFVNFCVEANANDMTPVVMHFAVSDYFVSSPCGGWAATGTSAFVGYTRKFVFEWREVAKNECYIAKEDLFLDFTMIEMKFKKGTVFTTIPVNTQPMDIVSGTDPHPDQDLVTTRPSGNKNTDKIEDWFAGVRVWVLVVAIALVVIVVISLIAFVKNFLGDSLVKKAIIDDFLSERRDRRQHDYQSESDYWAHQYAMERDRQKYNAESRKAQRYVVKKKGKKDE